MQKNGYTKVELLVFIAIFTIVYFIVANKISHNFDVNFEEEMYALTLDSIEKQSVIYGKSDSNLFKESADIYITVNDLVEKGYLITDSEGNLEDPRDKSKTLNGLKVKISNKDEEITAKVLG